LWHVSSDIQNKLLNQLGATLRQTILSSIQKANCYCTMRKDSRQFAHRKVVANCQMSVTLWKSV
jgi:hypothetical protein